MNKEQLQHAHWEDCWKVHTECAIKYVMYLEQQLAKFGGHTAECQNYNKLHAGSPYSCIGACGWAAIEKEMG